MEMPSRSRLYILAFIVIAFACVLLPAILGQMGWQADFIIVLGLASWALILMENKKA
jgi:hypothetical protein